MSTKPDKNASPIANALKQAQTIVDAARDRASQIEQDTQVRAEEIIKVAEKDFHEARSKGYEDGFREGHHAAALHAARFIEEGAQLAAPDTRGRIKQTKGSVLTAYLPNARLGDLCSIEPPGRARLLAQVVGFQDDDVFLTSLDTVGNISPKTPVNNLGIGLNVSVGKELLGRVLDSLGNPIDEKAAPECSATYPLMGLPPKPMERKRIREILPTGVRALDTLCPIGEGQRMGVFSAAGVGKSSLLGMIARDSTADVNVIALIGERGREVRDFLEDALGPDGLKKSVVVVSTSDETPLRRLCAAYTATAIAEYFRDQGKRVMLLMDSVTRYARALREIALSTGELPVRQGFPPSVFTQLPVLFERAGLTERGSITAFYTVLMGTEQIEDPLGEEIRALLDGHLYLSSRLSHMQHYPAIDPLLSDSRLKDIVTTPEHRKIAEELRSLWAIYEEHRDLITIGAYKRGSDKEIDRAIERREAVSAFLKQAQSETSSLSQTIEAAQKVLTVKK